MFYGTNNISHNVPSNIPRIQSTHNVMHTIDAPINIQKKKTRQICLKQIKEVINLKVKTSTLS